MKPIYMISNDSPPRYYMAHQKGDKMHLKRRIGNNDDNNEILDIIEEIHLKEGVLIKSAMKGIKDWVRAGKGRVIHLREVALIRGFDGIR